MNEETGIPDDNLLTIEQAIANLQSEDLGLRVYAAWWLGRFRVNVPEAIDLLIAALADEADRTEAGGYPLRRNAARALGKLGDRRAVPALIQSLECNDFYVREAVAQSLEMLGDDSCVPYLIELIKNPNSEASADSEPEHPYDAFLEALGTLGAVKAIPHILPFLDHPIPKVQYAAARAMYQLSEPAVADQYGDRLVAALANNDLQLRRTVLSDLGAIGYLSAAEAIGNTMAENSLKLISLKGLLEKQIVLATPPDLTDGAIRVMTLMDELL
ncbi:phycocyanobilin lyase [Pseudanabaena sp. SR411]|uniref:HEAT repeat domain-containing protein n=1 Tax=Pseudanabaena sp. SR411 TaxID=1980935 RepID=UPI000B98EE85|nr:HEAT repeat domain-containing protein [Pseudanabaena sp. SR411]OYQ64884.1 phycocyanobilin lyase [Pseudanabaena sp. SR411]